MRWFFAYKPPVPAKEFWHSNPDRFWGEVVARVKVDRDEGGRQFVVASWRARNAGRIAAYWLDDVRVYVEKYFGPVESIGPEGALRKSSTPATGDA